jgi:fatty-acyl-CoA synthase
VWITDALPSTATNKILKRELSSWGPRPQGGVVWTRMGRDTSFVVVDRSAKYQVSPG